MGPRASSPTAPLIHGPIGWQQFWFYSGVVTLVIAVAMFIATPREDRTQGSKASIWSTFAPYKTVLTNPQSYLCGLCAGLLFLPTTVGAMTWGVSFLEHGWHLEYAHAVDRAAAVAMGWVFGCPILGYLADRIGRRKPVVLAGAALMLVAMLGINYLSPETFPPYVLGFLLGFGSGAAMIPYSIIKEVNPDYAKGSATGAMNFLVFVMSALVRARVRLVAAKAGGRRGAFAGCLREGRQRLCRRDRGCCHPRTLPQGNRLGGTQGELTEPPAFMPRNGAAATVRAVASRMLSGLGTFRRDELALARGLRGAAAVALPLVVGGATGQISTVRM